MISEFNERRALSATTSLDATLLYTRTVCKRARRISKADATDPQESIANPSEYLNYTMQRVAQLLNNSECVLLKLSLPRSTKRLPLSQDHLVFFT